MIAAILIVFAVLVLLPFAIGGILAESDEYRRKGYMNDTETGRPWSPVSGPLYESPRAPWDDVD